MENAWARVPLKPSINCELSQREIHTQRLQQSERIFMMLLKHARILLTRSLRPLLRIALGNDHQPAALSGSHQGTEDINNLTCTRGTLSENIRARFQTKRVCTISGCAYDSATIVGPGLLDM